MHLADARHTLGLPAGAAAADATIRALAYDSRRVTPGALFVAIPGFHVDGHQYVESALARGAVAAVVSAAWHAPSTLSSDLLLPVADTRAALSQLAATFYNHPGRAMRVIGVTGTDGKTTTTYLISALLEHTGHSVGLMGTVQFKIGDRLVQNRTRQTTPEAVEVQALLGEMRDTGVSHAIVESSSHGLALHKLDHCAYDIAVVTNVGADHLELHGTRAAYLAAKGILFELLDRDAGATDRRLGVVNADDPSAGYLRSRTHQPVRSYAIHAAADVQATDLHLDRDGSTFDLLIDGAAQRVHTHLPGTFNVSNVLAAAAVAYHEGVSLAEVRDALDAVHGVPGRMQRIDQGQPFSVIVDYAHTGPAFEKVATSLRAIGGGRLIAVFGCAGERSQERRAGMGEVAARHADFTVLTDEDPYNEPSEQIVDQIAAAMRDAGRTEGDDFIRIPDRRTAIAAALRAARHGDVVLLAGKGHESSIVSRGQSLPWDEAAVAREELAALGFEG